MRVGRYVIVVGEGASQREYEVSDSAAVPAEGRKIRLDGKLYRVVEILHDQDHYERDDALHTYPRVFVKCLDQTATSHDSGGAKVIRFASLDKTKIDEWAEERARASIDVTVFDATAPQRASADYERATFVRVRAVGESAANDAKTVADPLAEKKAGTTHEAYENRTAAPQEIVHDGANRHPIRK